MIVKIRSKALVIGSAQLVLTEACTLMFQIRRGYEKMGFDEIGADKIMQIIACAAQCKSEEEHTKIIEEVLRDAESE